LGFPLYGVHKSLQTPVFGERITGKLITNGYNNRIPEGDEPVLSPADIDRRFAVDNLPDHGDLLANLARWAAKDNIPLEVEGRGWIDCELYHQPGRVIIHPVNLTSAGTWRASVHDMK